MSALLEELKRRNLPDLFVVNKGMRIQNRQEWEELGGPYWKDVLLQEEYGKAPLKIKPEISIAINSVDFAGKLVWETVSFTFTNNGKTHTVPTQLLYPVGAKNVPFFVCLNFRPDIPDRYLPVEEIIDNGFGIFTVCYNDITKDDGDFTNGLAGLFQEGERKGDDSGKIMYWSYMASQMMDYLQTREETDKKKIGVIGHSRLGKTALLTAALDERFAFACVNDSGCSGAALSHGHCAGSETIKVIATVFPYWFCPNYQKYIGKDDELPFDQHCLMALVAPRKVFVGGAIEDVWADNDNQFLTCVAASKAWELYQKVGLISPDRLPVCGDRFSGGDIEFHLRKGKHFLSRTDWLIYMDAVRKGLMKE